MSKMNKKYVEDGQVIIKRQNQTNKHFMRSVGNFQRETPLRLRSGENCNKNNGGIKRLKCCFFKFPRKIIDDSCTMKIEAASSSEASVNL
jgi:hypothetical protein